MPENQKKRQRVLQVKICLQQRTRHCSHAVTPVTSEIELENPSGYFEKIYPRSSFSMEPLIIKAGQRLVQIVFHKKEEVVFKKVDCLSSTERGTGGFRSTRIQFFVVIFSVKECLFKKLRM